MKLLKKSLLSTAISAGLLAAAHSGLAQTTTAGTATTPSSGGARIGTTTPTGGTSNSAVGTPTRFGTGVRTATGARFRPGTSRSLTVVGAPNDGSRFDGDLSQLRGDDSQLRGDDSQLRGDDSQLRGDFQSSNNNGNVQSSPDGVEATSADNFSPPDGLSDSPGNGIGSRFGTRRGFSPNELPRGGFVPNRIGRGGFNPNQIGGGGFDPDGPDDPIRTDVRIRRSSLFGRATGTNTSPNAVFDSRAAASDEGGFQNGDRPGTFGGRTPAPQADVPRADVFGQDSGPGVTPR